jgi:hypothetical protein
MRDIFLSYLICILMDYMKTTKLYDQWRAMDDRRLASKPVSLRLPVHVLARINAIAAMFPTKTRSEIMTDLLKVGLDAFEESLPPISYSDEPFEVEPGLLIVTPEGPTAEYRSSANHHYEQLEKELGNNNPSQLFDTSSKKWKDYS